MGKGAPPAPVATACNTATSDTAAVIAGNVTAEHTKPAESTQNPTKSVETKSTETKSAASKPVKKSTSPPKKVAATHAAAQSGKSAAVQKPTTPENQHATTNGPVSNGLNRRVPKSKWVPLEIELPKPRSSKARERNNNVNTKRRIEREVDNGERPRRTRVSSIRSGSSATRPTGAAGSSRAASGGTARTGATNGKRSPRIAGGIQKPRYRGANAEFNLDYPVDFALVKKLVANGATAGAADGAAPFLLPYMGTFYYNGVPSYANMDASSLKEAIKKQMYVFTRNCLLLLNSNLYLFFFPL